MNKQNTAMHNMKYYTEVRSDRWSVHIPTCVELKITYLRSDRWSVHILTSVELKITYLSMKKGNRVKYVTK